MDHPTSSERGRGEQGRGEQESQLADSCIETPNRGLLSDGLLQVLAGQYLSYHTAVALGRNVDQPRALAKSVTVP